MTDRAAPGLPSSLDLAAPGPAGPGDTAGVTHGFLFADLRDYTAYVEAHGDRAGAALLERYRSLVRGIVSAARGAEIRTEGDSFYVVFGSVSAAVRAGLAIVAAAAATAADPDPIRVGVGVHAGETVETAAGFVGSAVNIAARLCAQARAGEVVVSETVRGLVRSSLEVDFVPLGARRLKGVVEPVACYRVVARGAVPASGHPRTRPSAAGRRPWLLAAGLGLGVVTLVGVGAAVLGGGQAAPTPTPGPSGAAFASPSADPSASAGATAGDSSQPSSPAASPTPGPFPNEIESAILAALPSTLAATCVRGGTSDDARLAGFKGPMGNTPPASFGGVTCHLAPGKRTYVMAPKPPSWSTDLEWEAPADTWLGYLEGRYDLPSGSCATDDRANERWTGQQGSGLLACMNPYDGRPWIYFTFGRGRYLAFATRDDADYDALYAWFGSLKTFLR